MDILKKYLTTFNVTVVSVYLILFLCEYFVLSNHSYKIFDSKYNIGLVVFLLQVLYTIDSLKSIGPTELGALLVFGRPVKELRSGLVFIPTGICSLKTETRLVVQDELPADPEKIFRPKEDESEIKIPKGFKPPIRITFAYRKGEDSDPLNNRITAEVVPVIRWKIIDYLKFLAKIGSKEEARRQMEDAAVENLLENLAKITPSDALKNLEKPNKELKKALEMAVEDWGIELRGAKIKSINFNRELNEAITEIPKADLKREATILTAKGEKKKRELEGKGAGAAEKAVLSGRTKGLVDMAEKLGVKPELVLSALTAQSITDSESNKVIIAGSKGFADIAAMAGAIGETVKGETK
jgi:regulator of protease activity HflC (stomatin/prohibitin superfamily)